MSSNYQNIFAQLQMYIEMVSSPPFEEDQLEELTKRWVDNMQSSWEHISQTD